MAAIRSEGGLLPADVLARISALDRELGGLGAPAFHLAPNERIGEAVARSWARLSAAWEAFSSDRDLIAAGDHSSKATRERWLLPLFSELGYGRLIQQPGVEVDGKNYAVFCEYNHSPVHLVGAGVSLDRRTAGVRGAAEQSPHSLVQELLNRSTQRLWGIVTNGLSLRLLRDNLTLTRQAYVEFDLESIFATEAYEDFALLWLCAHQSRIEADVPEECWLEQWTQAAQRDGTRALGQLRKGVETAIEALGRGFLAQPANVALHTALRDGPLDGLAYYRELLRLIYRLLFLFVAEDRDALLLPDDATPERHDARQRYDAYYGTKRLRRLAVRRRGGRAHDLYEQFKLLSGWLHQGGQPILAIPPLGSALWSPNTTAHLSSARLGNEALLEAIRELAYVEGGRRPVDFRNLGAEELGSVYESLLELHPEIDRGTASFALTTVAGHERKQTGSYYTPTSLIGSLLETALDPVMDDAVATDDPEQALLDLTVCDPACGSGHFLIAAANRIAKRLAAVREHDPEPAPELIRHALRDVVSRCIYGVDVNPMAVELCKVSLWLEALEPGRPLSFLDDRILCGNSLLGATPVLIEAGVPDDAYKPLIGDDKQTLKDWKRKNTLERKSAQTAMSLGVAAMDASRLAAASIAINAIGDDSPEAVSQRNVAYAELVASGERERLGLAADAWVAAFVAPRPPKVQQPAGAAFTGRYESGTARLGTDVVRRAASSGSDGLAPSELQAVQVEAARYAPIHWHVAFPGIFCATTSSAGKHGWDGGFDCVLGNPPWERVKLQEKEFFAGLVPEIAAEKNKAARDRMIDALRTDHPDLHGAFVVAKRRAEGESHLLCSTGRYPLCGRGDVNTYAVFAEGMRSILAPDGRLGVIVPTGIATDDTTKLFFADIIGRGSLISLYDFENRERVFPGIDSRIKFSLVTIGGTARQAGTPAEFAFFAHRVEALLDPDRRFELTAEDIGLLNPNTRTCPIFRTRRDADLALLLHGRAGLLGDPRGDWTLNAARLIDYSKESDQLCHSPFAGGLPVYEAKLFHQFDHQFSSYSDSSFVTRSYASRKLVENRVRARAYGPWMLAWRDIARSTDERTMIASVLPYAGADYTVRVIFADARTTLWLSGIFNTFVFDWIVRQKTPGTHVTLGIARQLPTLMPFEVTPSVGASIIELAAQLLPDDPQFSPLLAAAGVTKPTEHPQRSELRADLDATVAGMYGVARTDLAHVLDSFPITRRKDEKRYGEYRTKRLVLDAYDRLSRTDYEVPTADAAY